MENEIQTTRKTLQEKVIWMPGFNDEEFKQTMNGYCQDAVTNKSRDVSLEIKSGLQITQTQIIQPHLSFLKADLAMVCDVSLLSVTMPFLLVTSWLHLHLQHRRSKE